jgi:nucleotide-binding universal stress UspA family protein
MSFTEDLLTEAQVPRTVQHLALDSLAIIPRLARRLPPTLAYRYHALPLAEDNSCVTVAMANPDDAAARAAIAAALDTTLYIVKADASAIDRLLTQVWPEETRDPLRLLVYHQASPIAGEVQDYAKYLADLLDGHLIDFQMVASTDAAFSDLTQVAHGYDLVVFGEPDQSLVERLLSGPADLKASELVPTSVLIARRPRWPLRRMLLITRGYETDNVAVDWIIRLAPSSNAAVTVLAVLPDMPAMCNQATRMQCGLADWLATDTPLGRQLRRISRRLVNWETESMLRFRQGSPERQLQCEVTERNHDLIVIAADHTSWWSRRLLGELVTPLLRWVDWPVLIAKPTGAHRGGAGG